MDRAEKRARFNVASIIGTHLQILEGKEEWCEQNAGDPFVNREVIKREKELWRRLWEMLEEEYRTIIAEE